MRHVRRAAVIATLAGLLFAGSTVLAVQDDQSVIERHARAAQQAQREGDFAAAIREFTALSGLLPNVGDVHSNLGVAYYFHKQPEEALRAFEKALRLDPKLVSALIFSGIVHHERADSEEAIRFLEQAAQLKPDDRLARTWLAHSYAAAGRPSDALDHFVYASQQWPDDLDVWYGLGHVYLQLGKQEVARLVEAAPEGARVRQLAGDVWLMRGAKAKALAFYKEALKRRPGSVELTRLIAQLENAQPQAPATAEPTGTSAAPSAEDEHYLAATRYRESAQAAFERIAAIGADSYRAHQVLAESLEAEERVDEAIAEYRIALRLKPDLGGVRLAIGNLLMSEGRAAEAVEEYRAETKRRPNDAETHYRTGRALAVLGETTAAEESFRRALALKHAPPGAYRELGNIYLGRNEPAKAVDALTTYLRSRKGDASAHYLLMRAYRALGDNQAAERQLAEFTRLSAPEKQQASLQAALSLFGRNDTQ